MCCQGLEGVGSMVGHLQDSQWLPNSGSCVSQLNWKCNFHREHCKCSTGVPTLQTLAAPKFRLKIAPFPYRGAILGTVSLLSHYCSLKGNGVLLHGQYLFFFFLSSSYTWSVAHATVTAQRVFNPSSPGCFCYDGIFRIQYLHQGHDFQQEQSGGEKVNVL